MTTIVQKEGYVFSGWAEELFIGNDAVGKVAATLDSLRETCKQHKVNAHTYLRDVLEPISTHPNARIDELLPYKWQPPHNKFAETPIKVAT